VPAAILFPSFEGRARALLAEFPEMPAAVIAEEWAGRGRRRGYGRTWPGCGPSIVVLIRPIAGWVPGDAAQCDLWFPPKQVPVEDG
jgi:hypothetical protein